MEIEVDEARVQYEEMIRLRDLGANTSTGVPYTEDQIMAMRLSKELAILRTIIKSDDRMSQLLTQLESEHEIGSDSGSGRGGDDEPGTNEDASRDEDDDGDEER
nr:hypothetical protein [Tanacetum cinerariifolium]